MGCEVSWLGGFALMPPAAAIRRRKRIIRCVSACARGSGEHRGRHWNNPEKRRRWMRPQKIERHWVEAENFSTFPDSREDRFILMSYNLLGVNNALEHHDLYMGVSFDAFQWDSRKQLICEDIRRWNADIVCLQEVDRYYDVEAILRKEGYAGSYKRRTGDAKDGCAVFWKKKRFCLLEGHAIKFNDYGLRDNVAQLFVFEAGKQKIDSRRVVVGNIHVLFNPRRGDMKLGQVRILLQQAHALSEKWDGIPVVLAGDFNCTPHSAIYEFLSTSELHITRYDRKCLSGQEKFQPTFHKFSSFTRHCWTEEELKNATGHSCCKLLAHPLKLCSSYARVRGSGNARGPCGEPLATTYHSKFIGTVDYIWYSTGLEPTRVLDTPPIALLKSMGGLPSKDIGSDHLAVVSEFVHCQMYNQNCRAKQQKMK